MSKVSTILARFGTLSVAPACGSCGGVTEENASFVGRWLCCQSCWTDPRLVTHLDIPEVAHPRIAYTGETEMYISRAAETVRWFNSDARRAQAVIELATGKPCPLDQSLALTVNGTKDRAAGYVGSLTFSHSGREPGALSPTGKRFDWCSAGLVTAYEEACHFTTATVACFEGDEGCSLCGRQRFPREWAVHERHNRLLCEPCAKAVDDSDLFRGGTASAIDYALAEHLGRTVSAMDYGIQPAHEHGHRDREPWSWVDIPALLAHLQSQDAAQARKTAKPNVLKPKVTA